MIAPPLSVLRILPRIQGLVLDVDGVLTDGRLTYGETREELKGFHVRDGHGLALLVRSGFHVGVISGRGGAATSRRLLELGIGDVFLEVRNKAQALGTILDRWHLPASCVAVMGDDETDKEILLLAGLSITVADAHPAILRCARWVTAAGGGNGAVRQVADALLFVRKRPSGLLKTAAP